MVFFHLLLFIYILERGRGCEFYFFIFCSFIYYYFFVTFVLCLDLRCWFTNRRWSQLRS
jgi:hypothetical protein